MHDRQPGRYRPEHAYITSLVNAVKTGDILESEYSPAYEVCEKLGYIEALAEEMAVMARHMDQSLLCYFFRMAATQARHARDEAKLKSN